VSDKLNEEIKVIRSGLGENWAYVVQSFTVFVLGFVVAFVRGWLFALVLLPGLPIILSTGLMLAVAMSRRAAETAKSYAQCLGLSSQAFKAIKLVQAYGNEALEAGAYEASLARNQGELLREVRVAALSIGLIYFLFYLFYAYALLLGGRMRVLDLTELQGDRTYTGGQVLCIMLCVILGSFDLGTVITHFRKVREGKRAARSVLSIIEQRPSVDINEG
jgi:ABC-type multidrug transport system fused ATPase/permease subunit